MEKPGPKLLRVAALAALLLGAGLTACGKSPVTGGAPDAGNPPPDAGSQNPDAGPQPTVDPPWDGTTLQQRWLREGFGEANVVKAVDVDGDGTTELVYGGRGVALLDADARRLGTAPRWSLDWAHDEANVLSGGENTWVEDIELVRVNDDATPDLLVLNSDGQVYALDSRTGEQLWLRELGSPGSTPGAGFATDLLVFPTASGDAFFPTGGKSAYSVASGAALWRSTDVNRPVIRAAPGDVDGDGATDLVLVTEKDRDISVDCTTDTEPFTNVFVLRADGTLLSSHDVPVLCGGIVSVLAANLDGVVEGTPPTDELVVGTSDGTVHALGATGLLWSRSLGGGLVPVLVAGDQDQDARAELYASLVAVRVDVPVLQVVALTAAGEERFRLDTGAVVTGLRLAQVDEDPEEELLAVGGDYEPFHGLAMVVDVRLQEPEPEPASRIQWRNAYGTPMKSVEPATVDGQPVLLFGGWDARVHALEPGTGTSQWVYTGGGYVVATAAGDLDGDGLDEVVSGDDRGVLVVADAATGHRRWARQLDTGVYGDVLDVAVADLDGDGRAEVVATAHRYYQQDEHAVVEVYRGDGTRLLSHRSASVPSGVVVADVEAGGPRELVLAEQSMTSGACGVRVMTPEGLTVWASVVSSICITPHVAVGNADGDAALEVGYAERTWDTIPAAALFEADGTLAWSTVLPGEDANTGEWVAVVPGGLVYGGLAIEGYGRVTKLAAADGTVAWQTSFQPFVDPEAPGILIGGGPLFGTRVDDRDGDGVSEWAVTTWAGDVHLLDGASGAVRWTRNIAPREEPGAQRHAGGPIAFVPATGTQPPYLGTAHFSDSRKRGKAFVLRLDGEVLATFPLADRAWDIAVGRLSPDRQPGVLVGAGLGVYAYEAVKAP